MSKLKKLLAVLMCALMAFSVVGCGGSGSGGPVDPDPVPNPGQNPDSDLVYTGNETEVYMEGYEAGVNLDWARAIAKQYEKEHANDSYEEGKKGLKIDVKGQNDTDTSTLLNNEVHLYLSAYNSDTGNKLGQQGIALNINDVVTGQAPAGSGYNWTWEEEVNGVMTTRTIEDLIMPDYRRNLTANDGNYYALPSFGIRTGLTYDANTFREYGFYFAHPDIITEANIRSNSNPDGIVIKYNSTYGTGYFCASDPDTYDLVDGFKLHWGRDGVYGTADDGLPTSVQDFLIMCDYMMNEQVYPLASYHGGNQAKAGELIYTFWARYCRRFSRFRLFNPCNSRFKRFRLSYAYH